MERITVGFGIDRDRGDPHPAGGFDDAACDLAAIGNQDSLEHRTISSREPAYCLCGGVAEMSIDVDVGLFDDGPVHGGLAFDAGDEFGSTRRNGEDAAALPLHRRPFRIEGRALRRSHRKHADIAAWYVRSNGRACEHAERNITS